MDCVELARKLIRFKTVTPDGADCLGFIGDYLKRLGFVVTDLPFANVHNLYARRGEKSPFLLFAGHVDVVPEGEDWRYPPYEAVIANGNLYGRGAVDMKGAIAAFLSAVSEVKAFKGSVGVLLTSDEEGAATHGVAKVVDWLSEREIAPDFALVGEPTSVAQVGDFVKNGRRGSVTFEIEVEGTRGHVAYPKLARNPITVLVDYLGALKRIGFDDDDENFEASNLEIVRLRVDNEANNVIPERALATVNVRFSPKSDSATLETRLKREATAITKRHGEGFRISLKTFPAAEPFLNHDEKWLKIVSDAVLKVTGRAPRLSTSGGTSDARFVHKLCPVLELGLSNETAHHKDERVPLNDLRKLKAIYAEILKKF